MSEPPLTRRLAPTSPSRGEANLLTSPLEGEAAAKRRVRGGFANAVAHFAAATLLLAACVAPQPLAEIESARGATEKEVHTDLVRGMLAQGQYYAALAHIQQQKNLGKTGHDLQYLEAEALRRLNRVTEADALYRTLLKTEYGGDAYHGLGLLYVERNLDAAVGHLRQAVKLNPTGVDARNDLGYALLLAGRYSEARAELATAVELSPGSAKGRDNFILLLLVQGEEVGAQRLAGESGLSQAALAALRRQAHSVKQGSRRRGGSGG